MTENDKDHGEYLPYQGRQIGSAVVGVRVILKYGGQCNLREEWHLSRDLKDVKELHLQLSGERVFQSEGTASVNVLTEGSQVFCRNSKGAHIAIEKWMQETTENMVKDINGIH